MYFQGGVISLVRKLMKKIRLRTKKNGQLFLLEVFIALSVLILLMIALFQVEFVTKPNYQENLTRIGYNALDSLNQAGVLKPYVYNQQITALQESLNDALPETVFWRLSIRDETGTVVFNVYWDRTPPYDLTIGITDYILYGFEDGLDQYRVLHLELWQLVG